MDITNFVRKTYFGIKYGDQDKPRAPHSVCKTCIEKVIKRTQGKKKKLNFGIPKKNPRIM